MRLNFVLLVGIIPCLIVIVIFVKLLVKSGDFDGLKDVLYKFSSFEKMITPILITVVYWLLLIFVVINGFSIISSENKYLLGVIELTAANRLFFGLMSILLGIIIVRIWCELMIIVFKINDNLKFLKDAKANENQQEK